VITSNEGSVTSLREELMHSLTALWHEIDHNQGGAASRFFTPGAELRFQDASFRGTAEIDEVYRRRAARGPRVSRHLLTNLHVLEVQESRVRAVSVLLLFAEDGEAPRPKTSPSLIADVWDEFERSDGKWLISSRWIRNLFIGSAEDLAVPTNSSRALIHPGLEGRSGSDTREFHS
jgi:hypothetical protein